MFFEFNNSSKVLTLTKVVEKRGVKNKKSCARIGSLLVVVVVFINNIDANFFCWALESYLV
ncbi:hypothetical protein Hanom_Chr04g00322031 [Helianthus anomalus]